MQRPMALRGPDGCRDWHGGPVGLGCSLLWNTSESKLDQQPLFRRLGNHQYVVLGDARIDNRQELADLLEISKSIPITKLPDSELILAAYQRWGKSCPEYLLGDFVFIIWDEARQLLFCARDHVGIKTLYYHISPTRLVFANDVRGVVAHPEVSREFDDRSVAIYLAQAGLHHPTRTFFCSIKKLSPGTSLCITPWGIDQQTYWRPEDSPRFQLKSLSAYTENLRYLLEASVRARIRSDYPIATHLSGGLDSSSIAVLAARTLRHQGISLTGFNWVHAPGPSDDPNYFEWGNSYRIAALERISHRHIELNATVLAKIFSTLDIASNDTADLWYEHLLRGQATERGVRTILSGWGGDEFVSYHGVACYGGLFWSGRVIAALREIYREARRLPRPWRRFASLGYRKLLLPLSPAQWGLKITGAHCHRPEFRHLLRPETASKVAKIAQTPRLARPRFSARADQLAMYRLGYLVSRIESWAASSGRDHIEYRYPLLDKRLVEFALGVPPELYRQQGYGRFLFRRAVSDLLPVDIAWGDFKWEPQRVNRNVELAFGAYAAWVDLHHQVEEEEGKANLSPYIETERLFRLIRNLAKTSPVDLDERIDLADGIGLALLVTGMGKQVGADFGRRQLSGNG